MNGWHGARKKVIFFLPNITLRTVLSFLSDFAQKNNWRLFQDKTREENKSMVMEFQVGQWGFKISGSQNVQIALLEEQNGVSGVAVSQSNFFQLVDWGANNKNLKNLISYLSEKIEKPDSIQNNARQIPQFQSNKFPIHPAYIFLVIITIILGWVIRYVLVSQKIDEMNENIEKQTEKMQIKMLEQQMKREEFLKEIEEKMKNEK